MNPRLLLCFAGLLFCRYALPGILHIQYDFSSHWINAKWSGEVLESPGRPRIPIVHARVLLRYGETFKGVRFQAMAAVRGSGQRFALTPSARPICGNDKTPPPRTTTLAQNFPESNLGDAYIVSKHGFQILFVSLYPLRYAPATGETWTVPGGELDVETEISSNQSLYRGLDRDRAEITRLLAPDRSSKWTPAALGVDQENLLAMRSYPRARSAATVDYLVIAPKQIIDDSDPDSLNRLLFEKNTRGVRTAVVAVEDIASKYPGADLQERIRNAITQYYKDQGIQYALLVGNGYSLTPAKNLEVKLEDGTDGILPSDYYYACLDGNFVDSQPDLACEVAVGRAPISSPTEMHAFVAKTILMQEISDDDPRLKKELNFGEVLDDQTLGSASLEKILTGGTAGTLTTEGYPTSTIAQKLYETVDHEFSSSEVIQTINSGQFYTINHLGHANEAYCMRFYNSAISQLTNDLPFFAITQGCHPGNLSGQNWASQLVVSPNGGAGAIIANSNYGFYNRGSADGPSNRFHLAFYDSIFRDGLRHLGQIHFRAKEKLIPQMKEDNTMRWVVYETNLLGDPELELKLTQ